MTAQELFFEDLAAGQVYRTGTYVMTAEEIKAYARQYDPQPFHVDEEAAQDSLFQGLAASGWHTAAITMKLLVEGPFRPAGGNIGARLEELRWPQPTRPGDALHAETEVLEVRPSETRPEYGWARVRTITFNQEGKVAQSYVGNLIVRRRSASAQQ
jgi:acyl dehydratase